MIEKNCYRVTSNNYIMVSDHFLLSFDLVFKNIDFSLKTQLIVTADRKGKKD